MRRLLILTIAPLSFAGLLVVGCGSSNDDPGTQWNDKNPWGTHRSSQTGAAMDPGTVNALPPATQPSR